MHPARRLLQALAWHRNTAIHGAFAAAAGHCSSSGHAGPVWELLHATTSSSTIKKSQQQLPPPPKPAHNHSESLQNRIVSTVLGPGG